jgi:hypothetical protein
MEKSTVHGGTHQSPSDFKKHKIKTSQYRTKPRPYLQNQSKRAGDLAEVVEHLPSKSQ